MPDLADRFEAKVDRSGEHHLWLGSKKADGTGKLKVEGRMATAQRVAWELVHGPLEPGRKVVPCREVRACVRVEHLSLGGSRSGRKPRRRSKGGGTKTKVRDGVWKLTVPAGRYANGKSRRESKTVYVETEKEAEVELARFVTEVAEARLPESEVDRDITMNAAVKKYLVEHLLEEKGRARTTVQNYQNVHDKWFAPECDLVRRPGRGRGTHARPRVGTTRSRLPSTNCGGRGTRSRLRVGTSRG